MVDISQIGTPNVFNWTHDYLVQVLTTGKNRIKNTRLVYALKKVKREDFVDEEYKQEAYQDKEILVGYGQFADKPTTSARAIEILNPKAGGRVLEIGTGSGYTAALIAITIGPEGKVFTIENQQYLIDNIQGNFKEYPEIKNVEVFFRDGIEGLPERAPYDNIIYGAKIDDVPESVTKQLNVGGNLLAPLLDGSILKITRKTKDDFTREKFELQFHSNLIHGIY